ncbi:MAG: D-tyrosyl-tRNA(Tyr) deacylase [Gammaproteobacteria bacterium]|nr:D-tyrosyl-tRNA(Tyr) deacylase [Gammaproteobacteria bacterium]
MIALMQRVTFAQVVVDGLEIAAIAHGVLAFIGVEQSDDYAAADKLLLRLLGYRIFADAAGKMNCSLQQTGGGLLLVPQFTLPADTKKGMRPSFTRAAAPAQGAKLYHYLLQQAEQQYHTVASGRFAADMQVTLCNDGPVTFWLQV